MQPIFTILGARGSRPVCDPAFHVFGGNTTCFLLRTEQGPLLIDAGTGLYRFDPAPDGGVGDKQPVTFLFTHFHLDHLAGLPAAKFLYQRGRRIRFFSDPGRHPDGRATLTGLLRPPFWPVALEQAGATIEYGDLVPGATPLQINGIAVRAMALHHPQESLGLSLAWPGCRVVVATDHEPGDEAIDAALVAFARDADYLLLDAQYKPSQQKNRRGWGHGNWESATRLARAADVRNLILIHHDPTHDDATLDAIELEARDLFADTRIAREGMSLPTPAAARPSADPENVVS